MYADFSISFRASTEGINWITCANCWLEQLESCTTELDRVEAYRNMGVNFYKFERRREVQLAKRTARSEIEKEFKQLQGAELDNFMKKLYAKSDKEVDKEYAKSREALKEKYKSE